MRKALIVIDMQYDFIDGSLGTNEAQNINELNRKITKREYHIIEKYMYDLGLENGYFQRLGKNEEKYVPNF